MNRLRWLLPLLIAIGLLAAAVSGTPAQSAGPVVGPGDLTVYRATQTDTPFHVPAPSTGLSTQNATINVTYTGFSPEAQTAFAAAIGIWKTQITSPVIINIRATWEPLGAGVLGQAGATLSLRDFTGAPQANTFYPIALANKLAGTDLCPPGGSDCGDSDDIVASFNSNFSQWYFGTDENTPNTKYDFMSVVLHEVGHGLGFAGSANVSNGKGCWGTSTTNCALPNSRPRIFDRFVYNLAGQLIIDTNLFPNPSAALAAQYQTSTGNALCWDGANGKAALGGLRPMLYAPTAWEQGSSYSHLDQTAFDASPNGLMRPALPNGVSVHSPGPVMLGMFQDMGWTVAAVAPVGTTGGCGAPSVPTPTNTPVAAATATNTPTTGPSPTPTRTPVPGSNLDKIITNVLTRLTS